MKIPKTLIDNSENFQLVQTLHTLFENTNLTKIMIATGFWDIPGTVLLCDDLINFFSRSNKNHLRLLIGKDPEVKIYQLQHPEFGGEKYPDGFIKRHLEELELKPEFQKAADLLLEYCDVEKHPVEITKEDGSKIYVPQFEIHVYESQNSDVFLHAKCYIFTADNPQIESYGIIGSSNFTKKGLEDNAELNALETDERLVAYPQNSIYKGHITWFEEKWRASNPWTKIFLEDILRKSKFAGVYNPNNFTDAQVQEPIPFTPYELYIKYLQSQFGDIIDPNIDTILKTYLPKKYNVLEYQLEAVKECYSIMRKHYGFILADVVGLGKTVVGMLLIKRFLEEAENLGRARKVLLITPPAIQKNWKDTLKDFNTDTENIITDENITFITTGKLDSIVPNDLGIGEGEEDIYNEDADEFDEELELTNYGLIVIDESHNFRNSDTTKYKQLTNLIDKIQHDTGNAPYVGLLSATPQNNSPRDLLNQIRLFQRDGQACTLNGIPDGNLIHYFTEKEALFNLLRNNLRIRNEKGELVTNTENLKQLKQLAEEIHDDVLQDLVVRRTRTDIKKRFAEDAKNLNFPDVAPPHELNYVMSEKLAILYAQTIYAISPSEELENIFKGMPLVSKDLKGLGFYRFKALNYLNADTKALYEKHNLKAKAITEQLAQLMQMLLVKRLESSFKAFKTTLANLKNATKNMLDMFENDTIFICKDIDVHEEISKAGSLENAIPIIRDKIKSKGPNTNNRELKKSNFDLENTDYVKLLKDDYEALEKLCDKWAAMDEDPKKDAFNEIVPRKDSSASKKENTLFDENANCPNNLSEQKLVVFTEAVDTQETIANVFKAKGYNVLVINASNRDKQQNDIQENFDANYSGNWKNNYDVIVTTEVLAEGVNLHRSNCILNYDTPWNATRLMQRIGRVNRLGSKEDKIHVFNFKPTAQSDLLINLVSKSYAKLQSFHTMFGEDSQAYSSEEEVGSVNFTHSLEDETSPETEFITDLKNFHKENPSRYEELEKMELKETGGAIDGVERDYELALVTSEKGKSVPVLLQDDKTKSVSSLTFMGRLKCPIDSKFKDFDKETRKKLFNAAINRFETDTTASHTYKKEDKNYKTAKTLLNNVKLEKLSTKAKVIFQNVKTAARDGNSYVINTLIKNQDLLSQPSLFGDEFEIWLNSAFASLTTQAKTKAGNYYIQFFEA